jgi:hypothetical protein
MPRGVEVRGDAAARDIVAIVVLQSWRFRYRSLGSRIRGCCGGLSGFCLGGLLAPILKRDLKASVLFP